MPTLNLTWATVVALLVYGCSPAKITSSDPGGGSAGTWGGGGTPGAGGAGGSTRPADPPADPAGVVPCASAKCRDFPAAPIIDESTPANAASMFAGQPGGAGPCLSEPEDRSLFPQKWLRPRIKWSGTTGVHRITIRSDRQDRELVAYTNKSWWVIPKDIWTNLAAHVVERDITITVRAASGGESTVKFQIAPVTATGSMVFWAVKPEEVGRDVSGTDEDYDSELRGFSVGDESTVSVLRIRQVMQTSSDQGGMQRRVRCIGCHVATPDDGYVAFVDDWPWNVAIAGVKPGNVGARLPNLTSGGLDALNLPWGGMMSFSKAHWRTGSRLVVVASSLQNYMQKWLDDNQRPAKLVWYNLDAPASPMPGLATPGAQFGEITRQGDPRGAACPTWSHDGTRIVYSSTMGGNLDGALHLGATDLYSVPFNDRQGGPATPLDGAADQAWEEYYPAFSPDDKLVIYTRVPRGERMYANRSAEIAVVPVAAGARSVRLDANDPPACTGKKSPGVNNHWAKWSPSVQEANGRRYYWVLFSSNRANIAPVPRRYPDPANTGEPNVFVTQLYMSVVVQERDNQLTTYPAVYLWNQPEATLNTTPIWEDLSIPTIE